MSYPIAEQIRLNILSALAGVQVVAGYNQDLSIESYRPNGQNTVGDLVAILSFDDDQRNEDSPINFESWIRPYKVLVQIYEADGSTTYDQRVNLVQADLAKLVMRDVTWGGYAQNTFIGAPQRFDDPGDVTGLLFRFDVHFRHVDGNPFSMTES